MYNFTTPFGKLNIQLHENKLSKILFLADDEDHPQPPEKICRELQHYFQNPDHSFDLELYVQGTPFQQSVWQVLKTIPRGKTMTYKEVAKQLNSSPRAVGNACRANRIPLIVPCHRVVAQNGLGGFAGDTTGKLLEIKKWLLRHESL